MTKQAYAVIGANWGDEGKGLTTDYLCANANGPVTVVRFNGGAQAGHTVQLPGRRRHVFHHFGSGSFVSARTHLSQHFICNPILFEQERKSLVTKGVSIVRISADPKCMVTTPWDMMINQLVEAKRGPTARHGSCGVGINETVTRNAETTYGLTLDRVVSGDSLKSILRGVQHEYVPYRLEQLGITKNDLTAEERQHLTSDEILEQYRKDLLKFLVYVKQLPLEGLEDKGFVFEGAQGLGLDEHRGTFPHVTRSSTGLQNVMGLCPELGVEELKAVYVTRPYITRHGDGPLLNELPDKPWAAIEDYTNVANPWQGAVRYAMMDEASVVDRITLDLTDARYQTLGKVVIHPTIMLTCVDQIPGGLEGGLISTGQGVRRTVPEFISSLRRCIGTRAEDPSFVSNGPTREDVLPLFHSDTLKVADE